MIRMNRIVRKYLIKFVSDHQKDWNERLHLYGKGALVVEIIVLFSQGLRGIPYEFKFGLKPHEQVLPHEKDYIFNLSKRMNEINYRARGTFLETSKQAVTLELKKRTTTSSFLL